MNARIRKRIHKIIDLSIDLKDFGHDCFVEISPHIERLNICCYRGEWFKGKEKALDEGIYLDADVEKVLKELDKAILFLEELIEESM